MLDLSVNGEGHRLRVALPGVNGRVDTVDLTDAVTRAVAHELWRRSGGNSVVNWLEAEAIVDRMAGALDGTRLASPPEAIPRERSLAPLPQPIDG